MTALQILSHAWRMITHDPAATLRVVLVPMLVATMPILAVDFVLHGYFSGEVLEPQAIDVETEDAGFNWYILSFLCMIVGWIWLAICWHRYALDDERPAGWVPTFPLHIFFKYLGKASLVSVPMILVLIVGFLLLIAFGNVDEQLISTHNEVPKLAEVFITGAINVVLPYISFRFGPALVATALGNAAGLRQIWRATAEVKGTIWGLSLITGGIYTALFFGGNFVSQSNMLYLLSEASLGIVSLLQISVVTTLYGVIIEARDLNTDR